MRNMVIIIGIILLVLISSGCIEGGQTTTEEIPRAAVYGGEGSIKPPETTTRPIQTTTVPPKTTPVPTTATSIITTPPQPITEPPHQPPITPLPLGDSRSNPASIGETITTNFEGYEGDYGLKVSVLEVYRGDEAMALLNKAYDAGPADNFRPIPPNDGYEYLLTKIKFEYMDGPTPDTKYDVSEYEFYVISTWGKEYFNSFKMIFPPEPELSTSLYPGASIEGWAVYEIEPSDEKPLINFKSDENSNNEDIGLWFKLYSGPTPEEIEQSEKESCEADGGIWVPVGISSTRVCNMPTSDGGKVCSWNGDCSSFKCFMVTRNELGEAVGKCATGWQDKGCMIMDEKGNIMCID